MQTFILLTRLDNTSEFPFHALEQREKAVTEHVHQAFPMVRWLHDYATLGPWDYIDVFEAPDMAVATKVSTLVRHYGAAQTEVWPALDWKNFKTTIQGLSKAMEKKE